MTKEVYIAAAYRTPTGVINGKLSNIADFELATELSKNLKKYKNLDYPQVGEVIWGVARQTSLPSNFARYVSVNSDLDIRIPAYTIMRQSISGIEALSMGVNYIKSGILDSVIVGGAESMSSVPLEIHNSRYDFSGKNRQIIDGIKNQEIYSQPINIYGELTVEKLENMLKGYYGFSDRDIEKFYINEKLKATEKHKLSNKDLMTQIIIKQRKDTIVLSTDEISDSYLPYGDGAAVCLLTTDKSESICEIVSIISSANCPDGKHTTPIETVDIALKNEGIQWGDIGMVQSTYITPSQGLGIEMLLIEKGINKNKINPTGSSIVYGNQQGASGMQSLVQMLEIIDEEYGIVISCAEGGQYIVLIIKGAK